MPTPLFSAGSGPIATIVNRFSAGGAAVGASISNSTNQNAKTTASGALTSATLATIHNITGRGRLNLLTAYVADTTSRTVRIVLTIDGTVVFDATSSAITIPGDGMVAVGVVTSASGALEFQPIDFQQSMKVEIASSLTETDKVTVGINYETWA